MAKFFSGLVVMYIILTGVVMYCAGWQLDNKYWWKASVTWPYVMVKKAHDDSYTF